MRALNTSDLPSGAHVYSLLSPNGRDGTSPCTSPLTRVAVVAGLSPSVATNSRFRRPSFHASQWRMNMRSNTMPVFFCAPRSSSFFCVQARSALQSAKVSMLTAMRLPSGETLKPPTSALNAVTCFGVPPAAGIAYTCELPDLPLRK